MKRIERPTFELMELFDECILELDDGPEKDILLNDRNRVALAAQSYELAGDNQSWWRLPRAAHGNKNAKVAGEITKAHMMNLYTEGTVKSKGRPREIYDDILVRVDGKCPYCGGIGDPTTLDHYLPKARFPAFSVLPINLVPSCKDCNIEMRAAFAQTADDQSIHPYFDLDHFFTERWAVARVERTDPILVSFDVSPPGHWSAVDKNRVVKHFGDCDLASRYSKQVPGELEPMIAARRSSLRTLPPPAFQELLTDYANSDTLQVNGWRRTLYAALAETDWFYLADFNSPRRHMP
jgi:hypothetical protein